jgi:glycosyltransferase involved in cell wall biosynthesis
MKIALVASWLNQYGGAERVLEVLHGMFPEAPIFTSMYLARSMPESYRQWDIRPSFLQHLPLVKTHHQPFLALYPLAFESLDLSSYDLVISNTSAFAHGVRIGPRTTHVCYCLTPARFLWMYNEYVRRENLPVVARAVMPVFLPALRWWDRRAASRVTHFVAISRAVADRVARFYDRPSEIIYPPVDTSLYQPSDACDDYYLIVSRLIPYKRIDLAVQAFNRLGLPLHVIGGGRDLEALKAMAKGNIRFLGRLPDAEVKEAYARCRGFVFPGEEDFGLTPLEAQASGRPVVAYAAGGALDTVIDGETGVFFRQPTPEALAEAVRQLEQTPTDPARIRKHAERFGTGAFQNKLFSYLEEITGERIDRPSGGLLDEAGRPSNG